jgi:hypothetical protein
VLAVPLDDVDELEEVADVAVDPLAEVDDEAVAELTEVLELEAVADAVVEAEVALVEELAELWLPVEPLEEVADEEDCVPEVPVVPTLVVVVEPVLLDELPLPEQPIAAGCLPWLSAVAHGNEGSDWETRRSS